MVLAVVNPDVRALAAQGAWGRSARGGPGVDRVGRGEDLVPPGSDKGSPAVVHRLRRQEPDTGVRCSVLYHAVAPGAA